MPPRYIQIGEADRHFQLVTSSQICFAICSQCHLQFWLVNWRSYWGMAYKILQVYTPILWELNTKNDQIWERYVVPSNRMTQPYPATMGNLQKCTASQGGTAGWLSSTCPTDRRMVGGNGSWQLAPMLGSGDGWVKNMGFSQLRQLRHPKQIFQTTKTSWSDHYCFFGFHWIPLFIPFLGITMYYQ